MPIAAQGNGQNAFRPQKLAGVLKSAEAYAYILESLQHYPAQRGVDERLRALGAVDTRIVNFLGGVMSINVAEKSRA